MIVGLGGADTIHGNGGNDKICGGDGNDILIGGAGDDTLDGGGGTLDVAFYGSAPGPVHVDLAAGTATGDGSDSLTGVEGAVGSQYGDVLLGDPKFDLFVGLGGDDTIDGRGGGDVVAFLSATTGVTADLSAGVVSAPGEGTDTLSNVGGFAGSDYNDTLTGDGARNLLLGMGGDDVLRGGGNEDVLSGGDGNDSLYGGGDLDRLYGDAGNDTIDGGADPYNVVSYALVDGPVTVDLAAGTATGAGTDTLTNISAVEGSPAGDTIAGDSGANVLFGGDGNDTISGRAGSDILDGGPGTDSLDGGDGTDTCTHGETQTACEVAGTSSLSSPAARAPAPSGGPPGATASPLVAAGLDVGGENTEVQCYYSDSTANYLWVDAPWTPHPLTGASGETEWFIPQLFQWDPASKTWIPATSGGGWHDWVYTYVGGASDSILSITAPFGGPWFNPNGTYLDRQQWTVPAGYYFKAKAWIEWHDANGNVEGHVYDWIPMIFTSDTTGPWCRF